jgi:hypothetical protein
LSRPSGAIATTTPMKGVAMTDPPNRAALGDHNTFQSDPSSADLI